MTDQPETEMQHHRRRARELNKLSKAAACAMYRRLGGLSGIHPPEKWRKDEVITAITEMEWSRLPEDRKLPTPPLMRPPCDECGGGEHAHAHRYGGEHHYVNTWNPDAKWVRADHDPAEEQPSGASATASSSAPTPEYGAPALPLLEGGTTPGVSPDQTRERPDVIPPALAAVAAIYGIPDIERDGVPAEALEMGLVAHGIFNGDLPESAPEFRPCADCRTPITCSESEEDRCP